MRKHIVIAAACLIPVSALAQQSSAPAGQQEGSPQVQQRVPAVQQQRPAPSLSNWSYDRLYSDGWSARGLYRDTTVIGPYGDDIGSVENVILGEDGKVLGIIAEIGGFLDIGDTHLFIPWDQVKVSANFERITVPVTEQMADQYSFAQSTLWRAHTNQRRAVDSTTLATGPTIYKLSEILGDYAYLNDRTGYGYVHDLVLSRDGQVQAVVVSADATYGGGYRAFPWRGYGWGAGYGRSPYYDLGYGRGDVDRLRVLDYDRISGAQTSYRPNDAATGTGAGTSGR